MGDFSGLAGLPFATDDMWLIGDGFNTRVFMSSDNWVLKTAKYHDVLPRLVHERDSLQRVPNISVETPRDYEIIGRCSVLPFGGSYHRYIEGRPCKTLTAGQQQQLGRVILEIHEAVAPRSFPTTTIALAGWDRFTGYLTASELVILRRLFDAYPTEHAVVRFIHGDIWPENLIERDNQLVGLLDWEQCGVGDVAMDFAGLAYLPNDVLTGVLRAYSGAGGLVGTEFPQRLLLARVNRELAGLHHAIIHPESGELAECLIKVRRVLAIA